MTTQKNNISYGEAIRAGFQHLLANHPKVFAIGQGLWAPWYVGNSMTLLEQEFGKARVIDSPVSECACTAAALGASLVGYKPIVVHPRVDFMLLAVDQMVTQAAKWSSMFGGQASPSFVVRGIVNRGGEQGAQHSQALHSWFAHIPGLKVVLPATVADARDLLIASCLDKSPVLYIDDRWLYELSDELPAVQEFDLNSVAPRVLKEGDKITLVGASFSTELCNRAAKLIEKNTGDHSVEVIDLRLINPLKPEAIVQSVAKTGRLLVVDGAWRTCGLAGEIIARVSEDLPLKAWKAKPGRITLPDAPAPTSKVLEQIYYTTPEQICLRALEILVEEGQGLVEHSGEIKNESSTKIHRMATTPQNSRQKLAAN